jgi:hypothetical protein
MIAEGAELVTEDLLVLGSSGDGFEAEPGAVTLHLLPDCGRWFIPALEAVGFTPASTLGDKVRLSLPEGAPAPSLPLAAVIILSPPTGDQPSLEPLTGTGALSGLAANIYGSGWAGPVSAEDLRFCTLLSRTAPVFALKRPWGFERLRETAALVLSQAIARYPIA